MTQMRGRVLGLDGCPGGWAGALVDGPRVTLRRYDGWGAGLRAALAEDVDLVAVDIPIGLPRPGEARACDLAARAYLGSRRSSVFLAPPRELFGHPTHADASAASKALCGKGISVQAWNIYERIAAVDAVVTPETQRRLLEVHPEIGFRELAGRDLGPKRRRAGRDAREEQLIEIWPDAEPRLSGAKRDDVLDALVVAWSGARWLRREAVLLPGVPPRDDRGLLMAIAA
jgi:predicted RNase H-like nuclease